MDNVAGVRCEQCGGGATVRECDMARRGTDSICSLPYTAQDSLIHRQECSVAWPSWLPGTALYAHRQPALVFSLNIIRSIFCITDVNLQDASYAPANYPYYPKVALNSLSRNKT